METRLFVGNLPWSCTGEQLRVFFERYGRVVTSAVIFDRLSGRSRGFGYVEFDCPDSYQRALLARMSLFLDGRELSIAPANERLRAAS